MSLEAMSRLTELTGMAYATIKPRLKALTPIKDGNALLYESRDALPLLYKVADGPRLYHLEEERARLAHHQANNEALKEKQLNGELLPAELVIDLGSALVGAARSKVLAIHSKIRSRFPGVEQELADEIETLSREALTELGSDGIPADIRRRIAPAIQRLEPTTKPDN